jgi:hypothetical protein
MQPECISVQFFIILKLEEYYPNVVWKHVDDSVSKSSDKRKIKNHWIL